eukprot:g1656.t1
MGDIFQAVAATPGPRRATIRYALYTSSLTATFEMMKGTEGFATIVENMSKVMMASTSFLATALFLMLSFRVNRASERWWEGRTRFGHAIGHARSLAQSSLCYIKNKENTREIAALSCALVRSLEFDLRQRKYEEWENVITQLVEVKRGEIDKKKELKPGQYFHFISQNITKQLGHMFDNGQIKNIRALVALQNQVTELNICAEDLNRIQKQAEPWSYQKHMRFTIQVWLGMLPVSLLGLGHLAALHNYLLLVPVVSAASSPSISATVLKDHVLRPSPFFTNEYITLSDKLVILSGRTLTPSSSSYPSVLIICEENFYNSEFQPFRVLSVDGYLFQMKTGSVLKEEQVQKVPVSIPPTPWENRSPSSWVSLFARAADGVALRQIHAFVDHFRHCYILVNNPVGRAHALEKIGVAILGALSSLERLDVERSSLSKALYFDRDASNQSLLMSQLHRAVETYVFVQLHDRIFSSLIKKYKLEEEKMRDRLRSFQNLQPSDVGLDEKFWGVDLTSAALLLREINSTDKVEQNDTCCPLGKVQVITKMGLEVNRVVKEFLLSQQNSEEIMLKNRKRNKKKLVIAGDDVLPLFVLTVVLAAPENLLANMEYISEWVIMGSGTSIHSGEAGFFVANFQAAVTFLKEK